VATFATDRLVRTLRRRTGRYYRDPQSYWEARHLEHRDDLAGPGCITLDGVANQRDYDAKWDHLRGVLEREVERGATSILDAGCGTGLFTRHLAAVGFTSVAGADFSATAAIAAMRNAPGSRVSVAPLAEISTTDRYDVVMCIDVLFHVVDDDTWERSVRNLADLTLPGGALIIQDSLSEADTAQIADHVRYRSLARYRDLVSGSSLDRHDIYHLPREAVRKDLLVFRRLHN
jgi:2-polyprenyl-3-methyl-5-hydroxy-6-metoxy-1,4-benzoquinol methylase